MSYRTILALASGQAHDHDALFVASDLARRFQAEARVLPSAPDPAEAAFSYDWYGGTFMSAELIAALDASRAGIAAAIETAARGAAKGQDIPFGATKAGVGVVPVPAAPTPWLTLLNEAPFADLAVVARSAALGGGPLSSIFADALIDLRLPIVIANGARPASGGAVVVAWNGSMEAGRAIRAAMPMLLAADQVLIAQQKAGVDWSREDAAVLSRCAAYLERHGVRKLETMEIEIDADRGALLAAAKDFGADLLVAGAYGHPRWQEAVFGGFTRTLFADADAPHVLVSH